MKDSGQLTIPLSFQKTIINLYGEKGQLWLENLPSLFTHLSQSHNLRNLTLVDNLSYNLVLTGLQDKTPIALKIGLDKSALQQEATALKAFAGNGAIALRAHENGLLILEQAIPGTSLKSFFPQRDQDALKIACIIMQKLHQAKIPDEKFPHIKDWLHGLKEYTLDSNNRDLSFHHHRASVLANRLLSTMAQPVLLHGDLHHGNILHHQGNWLAIDPKGVVGEPAYEVAAFIRNPILQLYIHPDFEKLIKVRIFLFSHLLQLTAQRIQEWCYVQSVLGWIGALNDRENTTPYQQFANLCVQFEMTSP
ncbi:aminoglycoside phosphotransferase family protein [Candidatus Odyssella acanthamoebae]|uniref:aminoglycoside phosphotransferase family protein n=1 Tax=Candidatus Odyssella acanthamoebae TaxID=91604 RepID=UPI00068BDC3C|nr:aminoglycoside phosphotransferase family protein [Candidatus Paracaedibacter acanthamoebae]